VTRIGELGTLAITSNGGDEFLRNVGLKEPHGLTSEKTAFFLVTAVEISNLKSPDVCTSEYILFVIVIIIIITYIVGVRGSVVVKALLQT
jgi:hypothetical protein